MEPVCEGAPRRGRPSKPGASERAAARVAGQVHYFTGEPCPEGHLAARYVSGRQCVECSRLRRLQENKTPERAEQEREYARRYRLGDPYQCMLRDAKMRAKRDRVPFALTPEDLIIPEFCPVLGIRLERSTGTGRGATDNSPSLDKIIPALGYVRGNAVVISNLANRLKSSATPWQLMQVAQYSIDQTFIAS
jgi:hypothetical protein